MEYKDYKDNKSKIPLIALVMAIMLVLLIVMSFKQGIQGKSDYISETSDINKIQQEVTFEIIIPDILYNEKNLKITNIMGQIVEVKNDNLIFKASPFIDVNADVLGIYDKLAEDYKYSVESSNGITYFRYRNSTKQVLINWVRNDTSYGLILDKVISIDEAKEIVGIGSSKLTEYGMEVVEEISNEYEILELAGLKFKKPDGLELKPQYISDEAVIYTVDDTLVLVIAYKNLDKYISTYGNNSEIKNINNSIIIYRTLDNIDSTSESLSDNYYKFVTDIDNFVTSIEVIE